MLTQNWVVEENALKMEFTMHWNVASDFTCMFDISSIYTVKFWDFDSHCSWPSPSSAAENSSCNIHSEFECGNGECINYQLTCDGIAHCKDKSDEKMQYCGKKHIYSYIQYIAYSDKNISEK